VEYTLKNGLGNPGVTRFRRHFVYLRPNIVVIYDELAAKDPSEWAWLLHSYQKMTPKADANVIFGQNSVATSRVDVFSSSNLEPKVHDQFFSPAINWKDKEVENEYGNHWHAEFRTTDKTRSCRFLAVFQIKFNSEKRNFEEIKIQNGETQVGGWKIKGEMDSNKPARLEMMDSQGNGVMYNLPKSGKMEGSTVIKSNNKVQEELVDILPDAALSVPKKLLFQK